MQHLHPYHYMRPQRIEMVPAAKLSYSVSRYAEDQDIRFGFGVCGKADRDHIQVAEIDFAWLGVVFHIVVTSEQNGGAYTAVHAARDTIVNVKQIAKELVVKYIQEEPERTVSLLETIHAASREQGHLEVLKHTLSAMENKPNLSVL